MTSRSNRTGIFELQDTPELYDLLRTFGRRLKLSLRTNTVGTVTAYNPVTQKVTVTVDILAVVKAFGLPDPDAETVTPPTILTNIPVEWQRSGNGYLTFPINPGDTGKITIMDRSIQQWLLMGSAVDPVIAATHALGDAVFEPGVHPDSNPITPPTDTTAAVLHHDAFIKLGRAAALGVARLTDKTSADVGMSVWLAQMGVAINQIAVVLNTVGPVVGAAGTITPVVPPTPVDFGLISTASSKVSAE